MEIAPLFESNSSLILYLTILSAHRPYCMVCSPGKIPYH